ncbi:S8 family serine peptidase [Patescibacteria group bacterium]|nr:S8 family serine peptidase [Patescibacteria group bacterium]
MIINITNKNCGALFVLSLLILLAFSNIEALAGTSTPDADSLLIKLNRSAKIYKIVLSDEENIDSLVDFYRNEPQVDFVEPNYSFKMTRTPNDANYGSQWYHSKVGNPAAWNTVTGSRNIIVAVLDTGIDIDHPDLSSNIWINSDEIAGNGIDDDGNGYVDDYNGWDFVGEVPDPNPKYDAGWTSSGVNHGTAIAGVVGALGNNNIGIAGSNWSVTIMPVRVLDSVGLGDTRDVYEGINYAVANGADIINLSFVGNNQGSLLPKAIQSAAEAGVLVIAAAGNEGVDLNSNPRYPVCSDNVLGVAGVDKNDVRLVLKSGNRVTGGSNYGSNCTDISAPSIDFFSTVVYDPDNGLDDYYLGGWSGTSLASPMVAGAAALLKAYDSSLTSQQLMQNLLLGADNIDSKNSSISGQLGSGRLNVSSALQLLLPSSQFILTGTGNGGGPQVRVLDDGGNLQSQFFAYADTFRGGVNVAAGDVDGDGIMEIITGAGDTGGPQVRVFSNKGALKAQFFAYHESFRGGVQVASGDMYGDGAYEIITGAGNGGGPQVRVFSLKGNVRSQFFAYLDNFRGGVNVAVIK